MPVYSSNTTTPTVGTENFLASVNVAGKRFRLAIDKSVLLANDVLEVRVYKMVLTGGTQRVVTGYPITFAGVQPTDDMIFITDEIDNYLTDTNSLRFSINQTFGTARAFPWTVEYELPDPANFGLTSIDSNGRVDLIKVAGTSQTAGDLAAMITVVDDFLDTEIAAIKAKTDNLPSDPADQSAVEAAITSATSPLATSVNLAIVAEYIDTEVAAIKAKTDNLPAAPAAVSDIPSAATNAAAVWASVIETGFTALQSLRLMLSATAGKLSGAASTNVKIRDVNDAKDRIDATVDADGNRTAVNYDVS